MQVMGRTEAYSAEHIMESAETYMFTRKIYPSNVLKM